MTLVAVAPNCRQRGFDGKRTDVRDAYDVMAVEEALHKTYYSDAHLVAYVVKGAKRQPRINKAGLQHFDKPVEMQVFFADIDNPQHVPWTDEMVDQAMEEYESLEILQKAGIYHTTHGRRIVQPISTPIPVQEVEPYIRRWFRELGEAGLAVDWNCRDWTRHYRLPHVIRSNTRYWSPYVRLSRMQEIELAPIAKSSIWAVKAQGKKAKMPKPPENVQFPVEWSKSVPPQWEDGVKSIASAVNEISTEWHSLFLAIAGALLARQVPHEHVPAICRAISLATGRDTRTEDREQAAQSTIENWLKGNPITGFPALSLQWNVVAVAVEHATLRGQAARNKQLADHVGTESPPSLEETTKKMEQVIRDAHYGVTLISAECGLGKTEAAVKIAAERAQQPYKSPNAKGIRPPDHSKTCISVDKNKLAKQTQGRLTSEGIPVRRIFGPLSVYDEDGEPVCKWHHIAKHLVAGGQSMQRELCESRGLMPCDYYNECTARLGYEGPEDARVVIGPHALIGVLDKTAGQTGLLIIDEPPPILDTTPLSLERINDTISMLSSFDRHYAAVMKPALQAVREWLEQAEVNLKPWFMHEAVNHFGYVVSSSTLTTAQSCAETDGNILTCVREVQFPDRRSTAPPLRHDAIQKAKQSIEFAIKLGGASRALKLLHHSLTSPWPVVGCIEEKQDFTHVLQVTAAKHDLAEALRRNGSVIVLDANNDIKIDFYEKTVGYRPHHEEFHAEDGAPIERTMISCGSASRTWWVPNGKLAPKPSLINAIRQIVDWVKQDPNVKRLGLITLMPIRDALEAILHPEDPINTDYWIATGQSQKTLDKLKEQLNPIFKDLKAEIILGHYGAIKGLNSMSNVDCLATLGDPWPNILQVQRDLAYLQIEDPEEALQEAMCKAELEQAHGRLRTVHRKRPGRALHVGRVLPGGWGWEKNKVIFKTMKGGRPKKETAMSVEELEEIIVIVGGVKATARAAGCAPKYIRQCRKGAKSVSQNIANQLRASISTTRHRYSLPRKGEKERIPSCTN